MRKKCDYNIFFLHRSLASSSTSSTPTDYEPQYDLKSCLDDPGGRKDLQKVQFHTDPEIKYVEVPFDTRMKRTGPRSGVNSGIPFKGQYKRDPEKWNKHERF